MTEPSELDCFVDAALGMSDESLGDRAFGTFGTRYTTITGCLRTCQKGEWGDPASFIDAFFAKAKDGLGKWTPGTPFPGSNWKLRRVTNIGEDARRLELGLERAIIQYAEARNITDIFNQLPATSGFDGRLGGRRCAVDLAVECHQAYDLIDLKMPAPGKESQQPPLAAAIQILKYSAAYADARARVPPSSDNQILRAIKIRLCVLGPDYFYERHSLERFERFLNDGLAPFGRRNRFGLSFKFQVFPRGFRAPAASSEEAFGMFSKRVDCYATTEKNN